MPDLDFSEVMTDPDLADLVLVRRRTEVINSFGEASVTAEDFPSVIAVVTAQSAGELIRRDDGQMTPRKISLVTQFRLRHAAPGFQPDEVIVDGSIFTITEVLPYTRFGSGFTEAIATYMGTLPAAAV